MLELGRQWVRPLTSKPRADRTEAQAGLPTHAPAAVNEGCLHLVRARRFLIEVTAEP
jgi:hypothetical protein